MRKMIRTVEMKTIRAIQGKLLYEKVRNKQLKAQSENQVGAKKDRQRRDL